MLTIHIGLPKTATTTFRQLVFPSHPNIAYIGTGAGYPEFDNVMKALCFADGPNYIAEQQRSAVSKFFSQFQTDGRVCVASLDNITSPGRDRILKAERLKFLFPDARIILTVRRPEELLVSMYFQTLKGFGGKTRSVRSLDQWLSQQWGNSETGSFLSLQFAKVLEAYRALFGRSAVLMLFLEDLISSPDDFARRLSTFMGVDAELMATAMAEKRANPRIHSLRYAEIKMYSKFPLIGSLQWVRYLLPLQVRSAIMRALSAPASATLSLDWRERIRSYARAQNASLCEEFEQFKTYDYF